MEVINKNGKVTLFESPIRIDGFQSIKKKLNLLRKLMANHRIRIFLMMN